jgi:protein-L-isoaspartate(D-aspartate) O-methyltransferase
MNNAQDMSAQTTPSDIAELRERMIARLWEFRALRTPEVERAFRAVPRHAFIPEATPQEAYAAERAHVTKRGEDGSSLSSVSASRIQAFMLEQAAVRPGMRVLEIGSGGCNAALLAELVGGAGEVTSVDIDPEVVGRARRLLDGAGYGQVVTRAVDGAEGAADRAPFDRIVVTVETPDLAPGWVGQLAPGGRIVAPLRLRGLSRSVALRDEGGVLVGRDFEVCGFVPMQGAGALDESVAVLHDAKGMEVGLRLDGDRVGEPALRDSFRGKRAEVRAGVTIGRGSAYGNLEVSLLASLPRFAVLAATRAARDSGLVASWSVMGVSASIEDDGASFAYLTMRPLDEQKNVFEFGAVGHGPDASRAAERVAEAVRAWDARGRDLVPELRAFPAGTPDDRLPEGRVLDRPATRFTISWPEDL